MIVIEKGLHSLHESYREEGEVQKQIELYESSLDRNKTKSKTEEQKEEKVIETHKTEKIEQELFQSQSKTFWPFAEITELSPESPSEQAGTSYYMIRNIYRQKI